MRHALPILRVGARPTLPRVMLGALLALPILGGCDLDELLRFEDDFTVTPEVARDTAFLENSFAGAKGEFAVAVGGVENNFGGVVMHTGLASDELYSADNFTNRHALDRRAFIYDDSNSESDESFRWLQRARVEALNTAQLFEGTSSEGGARHGELLNIAGFSALMLAENFCAGVPLSRVDLDGAFSYGRQLTTAETYDSAIAYFDSAVAITTDARQVNTALVGKARALLGKGDFAQAGAVAAQVPNTYPGYFAEYSELSQRAWNAVNQFNYEEHRIGASRQEGTVNLGLPYGTNADGRTPIDPVPTASNIGGAVQVYLQEKYVDFGSDIPLATAFEARYIQAEAALQANQTAQFETLLNQARVLQGLPALSSAAIGTTQAARIDTLFRERAYAMWLTGHRFSDMRRLVRQYQRPYNTVFPTGNLAISTLTYGTDASFPIPFEERNNPEVTLGDNGICTDIGA